jgi:chromosome segregation ATPase
MSDDVFTEERLEVLRGRLRLIEDDDHYLPMTIDTGDFRELLATIAARDAEIERLTITVAAVRRSYLTVADAVAAESTSPDDLALKAYDTRGALAASRAREAEKHAEIERLKEQLALAHGAYDNLEMTCEALRLNQAQTDEEIERLRARLADLEVIQAIRSGSFTPIESPAYGKPVVCLKCNTLYKPGERHGCMESKP